MNAETDEWNRQWAQRWSRGHVLRGHLMVGASGLLGLLLFFPLFFLFCVVVACPIFLSWKFAFLKDQWCARLGWFIEGWLEMLAGKLDIWAGLK